MLLSRSAGSADPQDPSPTHQPQPHAAGKGDGSHSPAAVGVPQRPLVFKKARHLLACTTHPPPSRHRRQGQQDSCQLFKVTIHAPCSWGWGTSKQRRPPPQRLPGLRNLPQLAGFSSRLVTSFIHVPSRGHGQGGLGTGSRWGAGSADGPALGERRVFSTGGIPAFLLPDASSPGLLTAT